MPFHITPRLPLLLTVLLAACAQQPARMPDAPASPVIAAAAPAAPVSPETPAAPAAAPLKAEAAPVDGAPHHAQAPSSGVAPSAKPGAVLPKQDLTAQTLYQFLASEIAGQRGQPTLAAEGILDLAKNTRDPRLARRATELALQARMEARALEAARLWLILDPSEVRARQTITALLVGSGNLTEAKVHLERLLADEGGKVGAAFLSLHQILARQSDKSAVLALIEELAAAYPALPEAHFAVAQAAWGAELDDKALTAVIEALRLRPDWEAAALFRGQILQRASAAQALAFYQEHLERFPRALDVRLAYARGLVAEKQYAEARAQFEKLVADFPGNAEVSVALGLLSMQLRDFDKGAIYLKRALEEKYRDPNAVRSYLGQLEEERRNWSEAANWYGGITLGEHFLGAQLKFAAMLAKQNRVPEAVQHLRQIPVQSNQQRVQAILAEAQILRATKAYQEAFDLLTRSLEKLPNYPDLLYDRAMVAEKIGRLDTLEQDLRKLIQIKPDYAHAYNALGYTFAARGERLDEAAKLIEKALELTPGDPFIMDSMGWVLYRLGTLDKALAYLRRAYAEQPDPEIAAHLGEVLWALDNQEEANRIWQTALKAHPDNEALLDVIKRFKSP
jgi:tetratricopeptide (TPR) repeat protein